LPFHFIFIFGAFDNALKDLIIGIGMLNIIYKSCDSFQSPHPQFELAKAPPENSDS
jgi:hypothetical protein